MAFNFRLRKGITFSKFSKAGNTEIIQSLTNRLLRIDAPSNGSKKKIFVGTISPIYQGIPESISYEIYSGSEIFLLPVLGMYSLRFISSGEMKSGTVRFFEKIGQLSDPELREIHNLLGMVVMPSADTKNFTIAIDELTAALAATATENVVGEQYSLPLTAFFQAPVGVWTATVELGRIDGSKGVGLSLMSPTGNYQGLAQLSSPKLGDVQKASVELTTTQKNDSTYPMMLVAQGQKSASRIAGFTAPNNQNANYFRLFAGNLQTLPGMTTQWDRKWTTLTNLITEAFLGDTSLFSIQVSGGVTTYISRSYMNIATVTTINAIDYNTAKTSQVRAITLL